MTFKDLNLLHGYNSDNVNQQILKEFYIPVLSTSKEYWRLVGYFSSGSIKVAATGIRRLIENRGKMRLITGIQFSAEDIKAIEDGLEDKTSRITKKLSSVIDSLQEEDYTLAPAKVLGWMLKNSLLQIKIVVVEGLGINHPKVGVMFDEERNSISFSGSNNESEAGWIHNIEEFKVYKEYEEGQEDYYKIDKQLFVKFWHGNTERCSVHDLPGEIIDKLIAISPESYEEIDMGYDDGITTALKPLDHEKDLYDHQKIAIQAWLSPNDWQKNLSSELSTFLKSQCTLPLTTSNHPNQGIFAMATASGKTRTAVAASLYAPSNVITIVVSPTVIRDQWESEIRDWCPENLTIIDAGGDESDWRERLPGHLGPYRLSDKPVTSTRLFILGTYETVSSEKFINLFKGIPSKFVQIIGDEVHRFGKTIANAFKIDADRVLGLSATHTRHWDQEGTDAIESYFGKPVYEFNIQDGINHGYLCHYNYFINFVELTDTELTDYREYTKNIGYYSSEISKGGASKTKFESLRSIALNDRAKIIRKGTNKPQVVAQILQNAFDGENEKAIIFCEDTGQVDAIEQKLKDQNKTYFVYHSKLTAAQRNSAIKAFKETSSSRFLLGIAMLDEGLDVPDSDKCIVVASTTNPRQFIQRRGRVLRISSNNPSKIAGVYDTIVVPNYSVPTGELTEAEEKEAEQMGKIINKEIERIIELNSSADNSTQIKNKIRNYIQHHNLQNYTTNVWTPKT